MDSKFVLSQGAGQKLEFAVQRTGGTAADIDWLSTGDNFAAIMRLRTGAATLVPVAEAGGGELTVFEPVRLLTVDAEGNIRFTLRPTTGMSPAQWEQHLERRNSCISNRARNVLSRATETPTKGVAYNIVVRPGKLIAESDRVTEKIRADADKRGWAKPHWEVACLIRDSFTDRQLKQMGFWHIITMHEPIVDSSDDPHLLNVHRDGGCHGLDASYGRPDDRWGGNGGFAFEVPRVSS